MIGKEMATNGSIPTQAVLGAATLFFIALGAGATAFWSISQTQLGALDRQTGVQIAALQKQIEANHADTESTDRRITSELTRREIELKTTLSSLQIEAERRRADFLGQKEFVQYSERMLDDVKVIREQLRVIESTRPTTGELAVVAKSMQERWTAQDDQNNRALRTVSFDQWKSANDKYLDQLATRIDRLSSLIEAQSLRLIEQQNRRIEERK